MNQQDENVQAVCTEQQPQALEGELITKDEWEKFQGKKQATPNDPEPMINMGIPMYFTFHRFF